MLTVRTVFIVNTLLGGGAGSLLAETLWFKSDATYCFCMVSDEKLLKYGLDCLGAVETDLSPLWRGVVSVTRRAPGSGAVVRVRAFASFLPRRLSATHIGMPFQRYSDLSLAVFD